MLTKERTRKAPQFVILNHGWVVQGLGSVLFFLTRPLKQIQNKTNKQNDGSQGPSGAVLLPTPHPGKKVPLGVSCACCDLDRGRMKLDFNPPDSLTYTLPKKEGERAEKGADFLFSRDR